MVKYHLNLFSAYTPAHTAQSRMDSGEDTEDSSIEQPEPSKKPVKKILLNDRTLEGEKAEAEERVGDTAVEALAETLKEQMPKVEKGEVSEEEEVRV